MSAQELITAIRDAGADFVVNGPKLTLKRASAVPAQLKAQIPTLKMEILSVLREPQQKLDVSRRTSKYRSADIHECRQRGHRFRSVWSDKTPMRHSLICLNCSEETNRTTFVAFADGDDTKSFGQWIEKKGGRDELSEMRHRTEVNSCE